ncbi:hypothetical protein LPJ53_003174 [Coemansia erecta]|uniref:Uncharacterized protein n=1 Tax=Coemansia erecta TaxID=147472 RepID=A0A9W7Y2P1_9FUNG|nr:hypothetical protein LPJ53_003174 [Coemansia erecta]
MLKEDESKMGDNVVVVRISWAMIVLAILISDRVTDYYFDTMADNQANCALAIITFVFIGLFCISIFVFKPQICPELKDIRKKNKLNWICLSCGPSQALRQLARSAHKSAPTGHTDPYALQTTSTPHPSLPPVAQKLRQKIQSNPHIKQLTSGARKCLFSSTHLPRDLLIRIKCKLDPRGPQKLARLLCIDELESYSRATGKSAYLPLSARGLHAALRDPTSRRAVAELGWPRGDIVEHCARVLRLRVIAGLHRARIQMLLHSRQGASEQPLVPLPPPSGQGSASGVSRLDAIRAEVRDRVRRQDAQWAEASPFIVLTDYTPHAAYTVDAVLPAAGLQCILRVPRSPLGARLSPSSEADARTVFAALLQQQQVQRAQPGDGVQVPSEVLDQSGGSWIGHVVGGSPEPVSEPTFTQDALVVLYACLARLTPESMSIAGDAHTLSKRKARRLEKKKVREASEPNVSDTLMKDAAVLTAQAEIAYGYSLERPGSPLAAPDGWDQKTVPVYDADAIFGHDVAATVVNWLLLSPATTDASHYVGVVALPCTVDLAAQLHRLSVYLEKLQ